jgi:23S rRNA (pseudouridine1915-N3)-methyltransferase
MKIISFVDSFKHYNEPIQEFFKRLWKDIDFVKLKPSKQKEINKIIIEETEILKQILKKTKGYKILLFIEWKELSTKDFAKFLEEKESKFSNIIFIIWWAYWLDVSLLEEDIDFKLSFSSMTFPHLEAILILLEQIYRVNMIKKGSGYHH